MNIRTILFPTDFSDDGKVLALASSLAAENDARLLIMHASDVIVPIGKMGVYPNSAVDIESSRREQLESTAPARQDVRFEHHLLPGSPVSSILKLAEDENADLIVMGTHGRTGLRRLLMGCVAEAIVRKARCSVLTVRQPEETDGAVDTISQNDQATVIPPSQAYTQFSDRSKSRLPT